ncbi:MAG: hypothetical protein ABI625_04080 [bacterium]
MRPAEIPWEMLGQVENHFPVGKALPKDCRIRGADFQREKTPALVDSSAQKAGERTSARTEFDKETVARDRARVGDNLRERIRTGPHGAHAQGLANELAEKSEA